MFEPSLARLVLPPELLILKKFLSFVGKCDELLLCLLEVPEKVRFSEDMREVLEDEVKN